MKKCYYIVILITFIFTACSLEDNDYPWELTETDRTITTFDGIEFEIEEGTESNDGLSYTITNKTGQVLSYGPEYHLEIKINDQWNHIEMESEWEAILLFVETNCAESYAVNWSDYYGKLPSGKYRIVKKIYVSGNEIYLTDEFEVE